MLGATGIVGQTFLWLLSNHEFFNLKYLAAGSTREGKYFVDEVNWLLPFEIPKELEKHRIRKLDYSSLRKSGCRIVFSALPSDVAKSIEPELRKEGFWVFSNASAMRHEREVPILIPEANLEDMKLVSEQGFPDKGFVVTNANCSITGLAVALAPLRKFGISEVYVSTYQSVSGAGYPGVSSCDILGNVVPHISGEEEKIEFELGKILGINAPVFSTCVRVPTLFGHLESIWLKFEQEVSEDEIIEAWESSGLVDYDTPMTPDKPIVYCYDTKMPQLKMSFHGSPPGMTVYTGRLRKKHGKFGFVLLVNNVVKGAAGGSIQNAEFFVKYFKGRL